MDINIEVLTHFSLIVDDIQQEVGLDECSISITQNDAIKIIRRAIRQWFKRRRELRVELNDMNRITEASPGEQ